MVNACLVTQSWPTLCDAMDCSPYAGFLCSNNSPGKNPGVGYHSLLSGIFPTQESNWCLLHRRWILYCLRHQGSPINGNISKNVQKIQKEFFLGHFNLLPQQRYVIKVALICCCIPQKLPCCNLRGVPLIPVLSLFPLNSCRCHYIWGDISCVQLQGQPWPCGHWPLTMKSLEVAAGDCNIADQVSQEGWNKYINSFTILQILTVPLMEFRLSSTKVFT